MSTPMSSAEFKGQTRRGLHKKRSDEFKQIGKELERLDKGRTATQMARVRDSIEAWILSKKGKDWRTGSRNRNGAVSRLYRSVSEGAAGIAYQDLIPDVAEFIEDTTTRLPPRYYARNPILDAVDEELHFLQYSKHTPSEANRVHSASNLYFMTSAWLSLDLDESDTVDISRFPGVKALNRCVKRILCEAWNCREFHLLNCIALRFGKEITLHGLNWDFGVGPHGGRVLTKGSGPKDDHVQYVRRVNLKRFSLVFEGGEAKQYPYWDEKKLKRWEPQPADTMAGSIGVRAEPRTALLRGYTQL